MGAKKIAEVSTETLLIEEISRVINEVTGVQLGQKQYALVQGRLAKRLRDLKITDPLEYSRYYNANESIEIGILTSLLTTHHTFFFREFQHFEYLLKVSLPAIIKSHRENGLKKIRVWSAACSRGQEVYSLTMFLKAHLAEIAPEMDYEIIGSDVCEESVSIAKNGVYAWDELRIVPSRYLEGNWSRGSGDIANFVRAKDGVRKGVGFQVLNLQELEKKPFGIAPRFDLIFCRNVFIYFNQTQIKAIVSEMLKLLSPKGHLFIGLSESLNGLGLPLDWSGPSVYSLKSEGPVSNVVKFPTPAEKAAATKSAAKSLDSAVVAHGSKPSPTSTVPTEDQANVTPQVMAARTLRVLCVDDSPTVLLLLKKILTPSRGFEIVGTASNGVEAAEKARLLKPDVLTLDIHMPVMSGVEFLEKHYATLGAPVVVVSSVPREDTSLAYRCLELGASDYIEKPSVQNLEQIEEEMLFKLRVADENWRNAKSPNTRSRALKLDASFARPPAILLPEGKLRVIVSSFGSRDVAAILLKGFRGTQPPTVLMFDGAGEVLKDWVSKNAPKIYGSKTQIPQTLRDLEPGAVSFMDLDKGLELLAKQGHSFITSALVIGPLSKAMVQKIVGCSVNHLIVEDLGAETPQALIPKARLIVPLTSFVYESDRFLAESGSKK